MIKANELRIGNWFMWKEEKAKIAQILELDVCFKCGDMGLISELCPIPLTPEVLERCGFTTVTTNSDGSYNMWGKELDASIDIEEGEVYKYRIHERERTKHIMYLHQLQNLYFALSGEELPVTL